jgi:hypothetical protein
MSPLAKLPAVTLLLPIATVLLVAPAELKVTTWLLYKPAAAFAASRRYRVPLAKPALWAKDAVLPHVDPSLDTSNPVGAVAVMLALKVPPVTVTAEVEEAEGVP